MKQTNSKIVCSQSLTSIIRKLYVQFLGYNILDSPIEFTPDCVVLTNGMYTMLSFPRTIKFNATMCLNLTRRPFFPIELKGSLA